ncbi:MAG: hypothetical protein QHJ81_14730 [Anaerolineae bacterium]|nr:hypothetical protein [Anaerolineae bacterium]
MDDELKAVIEEIIALSPPRMKRAGEFTINDYLKHLNGAGVKVSRHAVLSWLTRLVDDGVLETDMALADGRWSRVYWRKGEEERAKA